MKSLIAAIGLVMVLADVAAAQRRTCFLNNVFELPGSGSGLTGATEVTNTTGKSRYRTWSFPNGAAYSLQAHFVVPTTLPSNSTYSSVEVIWRPATAIASPQGVCWTASATAAYVPPVSTLSTTGIDDVTGNGEAAQTQSIPTGVAQIQASGAIRKTFKQVMTGLKLSLQGQSGPGGCDGNLCSGNPAVLLISRNPFCSATFAGAAEIIQVCLVE